MRALRWSFLGAVVLLSACQEVTEPNAPLDMQAAAVPQQQGDEQSALARAVPAFGGFFFDEAGRPTAYLTDMGQARALRARISALSAMRGHSAEELVILRGNFPYAVLEAAFGRATQAAFELEGTVFTDLDETKNQVVVGVERAALLNGAQVSLARAGLARGSYDVVVTDPIYQVATLQDKATSYIVGGLQIHFTRYLCTLGVGAVIDGEDSFITNSHCTAKQGGVESTAYYQPLSSVDNTVIATEVEDPIYVRTADCPKGRVCRKSDASRARYSGAREYTLGAIASTSGANNGSLTVTGTMTVSGKGAVAAGASVNKVGRTTGWTRANVTATCVNTGVSGTKIVQLCQTWVKSSKAIVGPGDSGSSVWTDAATGVDLVGLLWGGSTDNKTFIFSPIDQIEEELGTLSFK